MKFRTIDEAEARLAARKSLGVAQPHELGESTRVELVVRARLAELQLEAGRQAEKAGLSVQVDTLQRQHTEAASVVAALNREDGDGLDAKVAEQLTAAVRVQLRSAETAWILADEQLAAGAFGRSAPKPITGPAAPDPAEKARAEQVWAGARIAVLGAELDKLTAATQ